MSRWNLGTVKAAPPNVVCNRGGQKVIARVTLAQAFTETGGGDVFGDAGEEVNAGALGGGEVEGGEIGFSEGVAGAGDYDPFGEFEEAVG